MNDLPSLQLCGRESLFTFKRMIVRKFSNIQMLYIPIDEN